MIEKEIVIPDKNNLIINDTPLKEGLINTAMKSLKSRKVDFIVFESTELTGSLIPIIRSKIDQQESSVAIIFPGQGSKKVKEMFSSDLMQELSQKGIVYETNTSRTWTGNRPQISETNIPQDLIIKLNEGAIKAVWIIDDVVASGETIQAIAGDIKYELTDMQPADPDYDQSIRFSSSQGKTSKYSQVVFTWLKQKSAMTTGFEIYAPSTYSRRSGKVPVNSISTLLMDDQKGKTVKDLYAQKYFDKPEEFTELIDNLKKLI